VRGSIPNLRHLRAFGAVARLRSVNRAAQEVHLSQPAVTQAVAGLERTFGAPLLVRRSTGVYATRYGEILRARVDRALERFARAAAAPGRASDEARTERRAAGAVPAERRLTSAQVRALIGVEEAGSFTLAARRLGVAQPSLHRSVRELERVLGASLFERSGRGVVSTAHGAELARGFRIALREIEQAAEEIRTAQGSLAARLAVGATPLARAWVVPRAVAQLLRRHRGISVRIADGAYDSLLKALRSAEIDMMVGALREPPPVRDVVEERLFSEPLSVVVRPGHPLTRQPNVSLRSLAEWPWVLPARGAPTRMHFERLFKEAGLAAPEPAAEASSHIAVRGLLIESDMVTLLSRHQIRYEQRNGLLQSVAVDLPGTARPIGLTTRADWLPTPLQAEFLELLRETCRAELSQDPIPRGADGIGEPPGARP
jgi:DNA-binding transcriptional LysR family regulator